jgi:hypothetical protein
MGQAGRMITHTMVTASEWEAGTGWHLEDKGWCQGDRCIPLNGLTRDAQDRFDTAQLAAATGRAVYSVNHVVAVGPEFGGGTGSVAGARLPDVTLTDRQGNPVTVASLVARRRRMVIHAWAPW